MKRSSTGHRVDDDDNYDIVDDDDDELSFTKSEIRQEQTPPKKRKSDSHNKTWIRFLQDKVSNEVKNANVYEIEEFVSPKKSESPKKVGHQDSDDDGEADGKRHMRKELKDIIDQHQLSVRRFSQDYCLNKVDEEKSMTLIIRQICGKEDICGKEKLFWTTCRHVEHAEDRFVMFKPLDLQEMYVGAILRIYQPWTEVNVYGMSMPVIICTDFYRTAQKRENYFGVSQELKRQLESDPLPVKSNYIKVSSDGYLKDLLCNLVPFHLRTPNTISKQTALMKYYIDLDVIVYKRSSTSLTSNSSKCGKTDILICDSEHCFSILQLSELQMKKGPELSKVLVPGKYLKLKRLGVISRTSTLENTSLFSILPLLGSKQKYLYTLCFRHDSGMEQEANWDFAYRPIDRGASPKKLVQELDLFIDQRVTLQCTIVQKYENHIIVRDEIGDTIKINVVGNANLAGFAATTGTRLHYYTLNFVRIFQGEATFDTFSIISANTN